MGKKWGRGEKETKVIPDPTKAGGLLRNNKKGKKFKKKTYNSRYSPIVTDLTTELPIYSLNMGERTGSLVLCSLWSYVT